MEGEGFFAGSEITAKNAVSMLHNSAPETFYMGELFAWWKKLFDGIQLLARRYFSTSPRGGLRLFRDFNLKNRRINSQQSLVLMPFRIT